MTRQWDGRLGQLGVTVDEADRLKDHWALTAAWLTVNGSWETAPAWAKEGRWPWNNLGGECDAYGLTFDKNGLIAPGAGYLLSWPDGVVMKTPLDCGTRDWANFFLGPSGYNWQAGPGPFNLAKVGIADKLRGLGLPYPPLPWEGRADVTAQGGCHVSFFAVWEWAPALRGWRALWERVKRWWAGLFR